MELLLLHSKEGVLLVELGLVKPTQIPWLNHARPLVLVEVSNAGLLQTFGLRFLVWTAST